MSRGNWPMKSSLLTSVPSSLLLISCVQNKQNTAYLIGLMKILSDVDEEWRAANHRHSRPGDLSMHSPP